MYKMTLIVFMLNLIVNEVISEDYLFREHEAREVWEDLDKRSTREWYDFNITSSYTIKETPATVDPPTQDVEIKPIRLELLIPKLMNFTRLRTRKPDKLKEDVNFILRNPVDIEGLNSTDIEASLNNDELDASTNNMISVVSPDNMTVTSANNETIASLDDDMVALPSKKTGALPYYETVASANNETVVSPNNETVPLPNNGRIALPNNETVALPNNETVPLPNNGTIALPNNETVALPNNETVAIPNNIAVASSNGTVASPFNNATVTLLNTEIIASPNYNDMDAQDIKKLNDLRKVFGMKSMYDEDSDGYLRSSERGSNSLPSLPDWLKPNFYRNKTKEFRNTALHWILYRKQDMWDWMGRQIKMAWRWCFLE